MADFEAGDAATGAGASRHASGDDDAGHPRRPGRPSLGDCDGASPRIMFRAPAELKQALRSAAHRTGRRESDIAREALERYLGHGAAPDAGPRRTTGNDGRGRGGRGTAGHETGET